MSLFVLSAFIVACSQNAVTGRTQFTLVPESELRSMANQQYKQFLSENRVLTNSSNRDVAMVKKGRTANKECRV